MTPSELDITVSTKATQDDPLVASDFAIEELEERVVPGVSGACACTCSCSCTSCSCIVWF
jgi:hypothetical protein